jgi:hypothetical protein
VADTERALPNISVICSSGPDAVEDGGVAQKYEVCRAGRHQIHAASLVRTEARRNGEDVTTGDGRYQAIAFAAYADPRALVTRASLWPLGDAARKPC